MFGTLKSIGGAIVDGTPLNRLKSNEALNAMKSLGEASSDVGAAKKARSRIMTGDLDRASEEMVERKARQIELEKAGKTKAAEKYALDTAAMSEVYGAAGLTDAAGNFTKTGKLSKEDITAARGKIADTIASKQKAVDKSTRGMIDATKDYFWDEDMGTRAMRIGAATAAYGAAAVGTRSLTGGSATHNNQGKRDIAGIPFI